MPTLPSSPLGFAHLLSHMLDAVAATGQMKRFPVDVTEIALQVSAQFAWTDPIIEVKAAPIPGFEGGLFPVDTSGWLLLYNDRIKSVGAGPIHAGS